MPKAIGPEEYRRLRDLVLYQLDVTHAFDGLRFPDHVARDGFQVAVVDAIVSYLLQLRYITSLMDRPADPWERSYRRFLLESPKIPGRPRHRRVFYAGIRPVGLILRLIGLYRGVADLSRSKRKDGPMQRFLDANLPAILQIVPGLKLPEGPAFWQRVKRAGGVGMADGYAKSALSQHRDLRPYRKSRDEGLDAFIDAPLYGRRRAGRTPRRKK